MERALRAEKAGPAHATYSVVGAPGEGIKPPTYRFEGFLPEGRAHFVMGSCWRLDAGERGMIVCPVEN